MIDELLRLLVTYVDINTLLCLGRTARSFVLPVQEAPQWELAFTLLSKSNTFNLFVREQMEEQGEKNELDVSAFLLSDPRLSDDFDALPSYKRFQALAPFCRASVEHFRDLHDIWGRSGISSLQFGATPGTPREVQINRLQDLEVRAGAKTFSRYGVMANLTQLVIAQSELDNESGPCYWYDQLGEADCQPWSGSSYGNCLTATFIDPFVDDDKGYGQADPALAGVEVGSNAHLQYLASCRPIYAIYIYIYMAESSAGWGAAAGAGGATGPAAALLPVSLFGETLRHFEVLHAALTYLPGIIEMLEDQEEDDGEDEEEVEVEVEGKMKVGGEGVGEAKVEGEVKAEAEVKVKVEGEGEGEVEK